MGVDLRLLFCADENMMQWGSDLASLLPFIGARTALHAVAAVLYCVFVLHICDGEIFSSRQANLLLAVATFMLMAAALSAVYQTIFPMTPDELEWQLASCVPEADPAVFAFSFMMFALAGVFKYGQVLQEDSDNIL